jgi:hypothetical protein
VIAIAFVPAAERTSPVGAETAVVEPSEFFAVTTPRRRRPMSPAVTW